MSDIRLWDPVANGNQDPVPDGFKEGMDPGGLNNSSREVMAAVRRQWEQGEWFDWGHEVTYVSGTSFSIPGDVTGIYTVGRRVRLYMPVAGTIYGRVDSAVFVTSTTITVTWDSGTLQLESGIQAAVGIVSTVNSSLPVDWAKGALGLKDADIMCYESKAFWQGQIDSILASINPIGTIQPWPSATPPSAQGTWLTCDGSEVSQTTYAALFALIGHTFGPDPLNGNFVLPDLRGRTPFGYDAANASGRMVGYRQGINASAVGNSGGEAAHTQIVGELARHRHNTDGGGVPASTGADGENTNIKDQPGPTAYTGNDEPMNVTPPGLVLNWVIRAE